MDKSVEIHLAKIEQSKGEAIAQHLSPEEWLGRVAGHLTAIVSIQEHRISALEQEIKELKGVSDGR